MSSSNASSIRVAFVGPVLAGRLTTIRYIAAASNLSMPKPEEIPWNYSPSGSAFFGRLGITVFLRRVDIINWGIEGISIADRTSESGSSISNNAMVATSAKSKQVISNESSMARWNDLWECLKSMWRTPGGQELDANSHIQRLSLAFSVDLEFLRGCDIIVFVAPSQADRIPDCATSRLSMEAALREIGRPVASVPILFQLNSRDVPDALSLGEFRERMELDPSWKVVETVATKGIGLELLMQNVVDIVKATR